jgi:hypothetical protein
MFTSHVLLDNKKNPKIGLDLLKKKDLVTRTFFEGSGVFPAQGANRSRSRLQKK